MAKQNVEEGWSDFRVGLVTFAAIFFVVLGVTFAGGDKGLLFHDTLSLKAWLADVGGLKKGSPVSMGGMTVGKVTRIDFNGHQGPQPIEVTMEVRSDVRDKIKTDSLPVIRTQGMLGDRYLDISMGSEEAVSLKEGEPLVGGTATDFDKTLREATEVLNETDKLLKAVNTQEGTAGKLVYDEKLYDTLARMTEELHELIKDFKKNPRKYVKFSIF